jgi:hypothetical protein
MKGLREIELHPEGQGTILLLVTVATQSERWGAFEQLRGTSWGKGITEVSGDAMSHALHGYAHPLVRELGRPPSANGKHVKDAEGACALHQGCLGWDTAYCRPGGSKKGEPGPPACYEAPIMGASFVATRVCLAWKEGRHTIVVTSPEFSLL